MGEVVGRKGLQWMWRWDLTTLHLEQGVQAESAGPAFSFQLLSPSTEIKDLSLDMSASK